MQDMVRKKEKTNRRKHTFGHEKKDIKRYMHGELAPDAPKAPNEPMAIDPNSKVMQGKWLVMVMMLKVNLNQK